MTKKKRKKVQLLLQCCVTADTCCQIISLFCTNGYDSPFTNTVPNTLLISFLPWEELDRQVLSGGESGGVGEEGVGKGETLLKTTFGPHHGAFGSLHRPQSLRRTWDRYQDIWSHSQQLTLTVWIIYCELIAMATSEVSARSHNNKTVLRKNALVSRLWRNHYHNFTLRVTAHLRFKKMSQMRKKCSLFFCVISCFTRCSWVHWALQLSRYSCLLFVSPGLVSAGCPEVSGSCGGQRSRGVLPRPIGQAEPLQLLSALVVDSHQVAVLLCQTPKLLLQAGDLHGNLLILHQLGQQLTPTWTERDFRDLRNRCKQKTTTK